MPMWSLSPSRIWKRGTEVSFYVVHLDHWPLTSQSVIRFNNLSMTSRLRTMEDLIKGTYGKFPPLQTTNWQQV